MNRTEQLYRWVRIAYKLGAHKSIWLIYGQHAITQTGSAPMTIAG